jgi:surfactin family lipopeptide synthetase A/lichenysin synthetase A
MVKLKDASDVEGWRRAIRQVVSDSEGLRLRMVVQDGEVRQYVAPDQPTEIQYLDFSHPNGVEEYRRWMDQALHSRLRVVGGPLYDFAILRLGSQDYRLFVKVHHLVADGWSIAVLTEQVLKHYRALQSGEALNEPPPGSFVDYIVQQTAPRALDKAKLFLYHVFDKLSTAPAALRLRPGLPAAVTAQASRLSFTVPADLRAEIARSSESSHSSVYLFFLSGVLLYISLANAAEDAAIGTLFHNRLNPAYQNTVGLFNVILPLRVKAAGDLSFGELTRRVFAAWKQAIQRQPGHLSQQEFATVRQRAAELFDVLVSYESHLPDEPPEWLPGAAELEPISLWITILDHPTAGLEMEFLYRTELFSQAEMATTYQQLMNLWVEVLADPDRKIGELCSILQPYMSF